MKILEKQIVQCCVLWRQSAACVDFTQSATAVRTVEDCVRLLAGTEVTKAGRAGTKLPKQTAAQHRASIRATRAHTSDELTRWTRSTLYAMPTMI